MNHRFLVLIGLMASFLTYTNLSAVPTVPVASSTMPVEHEELLAILNAYNVAPSLKISKEELLHLLSKITDHEEYLIFISILAKQALYIFERIKLDINEVGTLIHSTIIQDTLAPVYYDLYLAEVIPGIKKAIEEKKLHDTKVEAIITLLEERLTTAVQQSNQYAISQAFKDAIDSIEKTSFVSNSEQNEKIQMIFSDIIMKAQDSYNDSVELDIAQLSILFNILSIIEKNNKMLKNSQVNIKGEISFLLGFACDLGSCPEDTNDNDSAKLERVVRVFADVLSLLPRSKPSKKQEALEDFLLGLKFLHGINGVATGFDDLADFNKRLHTYESVVIE